MTSLMLRSGFLILYWFGITWANTSIAQRQTLNHDGLERTYLVHLPPNYNQQSHLPLIVAMHGGFGSANNLQNQSQLSAKADQENFIVVYPEGIQGGFLNIRTWNGGGCCGHAMSDNIDDVGFIDALLDKLMNEYAIDSQRIYATGMSNGGILAYRLACELSDRIAAIAPVACAMILDECQPSRPVPIIHFHSYLDSSIIHSGGVGLGVSMVDAPAQLDNFGQWSDSNGCQNILDTISYDGQLTHTQWTNCDCGTEIQYYITQDGGHSWPGGMATPLGDPVSEVINANDIMWDFFKNYTLDCNSSTGSNDLQPTKNFEIYPNFSTTGQFEIRAPQGIIISRMVVFDGSGSIVARNNKLKAFNVFTPGIYFVQILSNHSVETHRVVYL